MSKRDVRIYKSMQAEVMRAHYAEQVRNESEAKGLLFTVIIAVCAFLLGVK